MRLKGIVVYKVAKKFVGGQAEPTLEMGHENHHFTGYWLGDYLVAGSAAGHIGGDPATGIKPFNLAGGDVGSSPLAWGFASRISRRVVFDLHSVVLLMVGQRRVMVEQLLLKILGEICGAHVDNCDKRRKWKRGVSATSKGRRMHKLVYKMELLRWRLRSNR